MLSLNVMYVHCFQSAVQLHNCLVQNSGNLTFVCPCSLTRAVQTPGFSPPALAKKTPAPGEKTPAPAENM